ncbi:MAG: ferredoxin [Bacteroidales bacterium]|jgi:ferredoxin
MINLNFKKKAILLISGLALITGTTFAILSSDPIEAKIVEDLCVGCGFCESLAPDIFDVIDEVATFTSIAPNGNIPSVYYEQFLDAYAVCPTYALKFAWEQE